MRKSESFLKNEMSKILRDFKVQTDEKLSARGTDLVEF